MKKIKFHLSILLLFIACLLIITSCEDALNEQQYSTVSVDDFYKNEVQANRALSGIYESYWRKTYRDATWLQMNEQPTNILQDPDPNKGTYDKFAWNVSDGTLQNLWEGVYRGSNRAGTLLDKLEKSNIDQETKDHMAGQARFLRDLDYFNAVRIFGGVPVYEHGTFDLSDINKPRASADSVYQFLINDLTKAVDELGSFSQEDQQAGRVTSGAAMGLLAKVYIQHKEWQKAADEAKKVIDLGAYDLFADYADIFDPDNSNGKEWLFSIQHGQGRPGSHVALHQVYELSPPPLTLPDGTSIEFFKYHDKGTYDRPEEPFFSETPDTYRKWMTMRDKMPFYYKKGSTDIVRDTVALEYPFLVKYYKPDLATGMLKTGINTPILRYSDILLMYAEALNEVNASPPQAAYDAINKVRARARGVDTPHEQPESVYPPLSGLNKEQFRDSLLVEDAREFIGEGHYRSQLLRHDLLIKRAQAAGITNADDNHNIYPIPSGERGRNPNLTQNPGY